MTADYTKAATRAIETLIEFGVTSSPISPLPMLEKMKNVIVLSFSELSELSGMRVFDFAQAFKKNFDAMTSANTENGVVHYTIAYNSFLPFSVLQRALAREMGHIVLGHVEYSEENNEEALCFAHHLLCPRPLIHALQATCLRLTNDLIANITGAFEHSITAMRKLPRTDVPVHLNRFLRNQITPFVINYFNFYQTAVFDDGSALADLGSFMEGYCE